MILRKVNYIDNGSIYENRNIEINDGLITDITKGEGTPSFDSQSLLTAGYIDIHTHGAVGVDFGFADQQGLDRVDKYFRSIGTAFYCPTVATADYDNTLNAIQNVKQYKSNNQSGIIGVHLEGPFLSPAMAGAHKVSLLQGYSEKFVEMIARNSDIVSRVTMACSVDGADKIFERLMGCGIQVSLGHDDSLEPQFLPFMMKGACSTTHLFNRCSTTGKIGLRKYLGITEATLLFSEQYAELIADGMHTANGQIALLCKNKSEYRICLISDSLGLLGLDIESVRFEDYVIEVRDNVAVIKGTDTFAGSVTPVAKQVQNLVSWGYSLEKAVTMATVSPASLLKRQDIGRIAKQKKAIFNLITEAGVFIKSIEM